MKFAWRLLLSVMVLGLVTAACGSTNDQTPSSQPQGPALIMFYTDG
jgi:hypothetical protein